MEWADVEEVLPLDVQRVVLGFMRKKQRKKHILLQLIKRRLISCNIHSWVRPGPQHDEDTPGWWGVLFCFKESLQGTGPFRFISIIRSEDGREGRVYAWQTHRSFKSYLWRQIGDRPWTLAPSIQNSHL